MKERLGDEFIRRRASLVRSLREAGMDARATRARVGVFEAFDTNGDGVVDQEELRRGLAARFGATSADATQLMSALMNEFDGNGNGVLEVDEFVVGQIKRRVELGEDERRRQARAAVVQAQAAEAAAAKPLLAKIGAWLRGGKNDDDDAGGGQDGDGGGGYAPSRAYVPVPVPVRKPGPEDWFP